MWLAFHAFVLAYEEPVLAESFGAQYEDFRANVPRWIPGLFSVASRLTDLMLGEVETSESGPSRRFVAMQQYVGHRRHTDSGKPFAWRVYRLTAIV